MAKIYILILLIACTLSGFSQQSNTRQYVVKFADKGNLTKSSINPQYVLTDAAIERRVRHHIAFDETDIPVNQEYISVLTNEGVKVLVRSRWLNLVVIEADPSLMKTVSKFPFIADIKPLASNSNQSKKDKFIDEPIKLQTTTKKPKSLRQHQDIYDYGYAYNQISQLHGQYFHNMGYCGQGMTIAVLDAGFNSVDVLDCFDSLRTNGQILGTADMAEPGNNVYGTYMHTHGTSVLSCMAANLSGVMIGTAPKANYWLIRTEVGDYERVIEEYFWLAGAEFADSVGASLINSSLGYTEFENDSANHTYADMDGNTAIVTIAADMAAQKGILVVNSAGNEGSSAWHYIGAPADGDSVFSIGAVDADGLKAYFSSFGPTYDGRIKPDVSALGVNATIFSPYGLSSGSGTSFSSPITCGITACLWQALPDSNNMQIIEIMKQSGSRGQQPDSLLGWGIPDMEKTIINLNIPKVQNVDFNIYPNPFLDEITLIFRNPEVRTEEIEIFNPKGERVYAAAANDFRRTVEIKNLQNLPAGVYMVKVKSENQVYVQKLIKL